MKLIHVGRTQVISFNEFYKQPKYHVKVSYWGRLFFRNDIHWCYSNGFFYIRIKNFLILIKNHKKHELLFSQRNRIKRKGLYSKIIGKYYFEIDNKNIPL